MISFIPILGLIIDGHELLVHVACASSDNGLTSVHGFEPYPLNVYVYTHLESVSRRGGAGQLGHKFWGGTC